MIINENADKDRAIYHALLDHSKSRSNGYDNDTYIKNVLARTYNIKRFQFNDYIKALVCSQLSYQIGRDKIESHMSEIDALFFHFDRSEILNRPYTYFYDGIRQLKCGNMLIRKQMEALAGNIHTLEIIEKDHDFIDIYFGTSPVHKIVREISSGKYKLKYIGADLVWEFLRNAGIDFVKPGLHMNRIFGADRLGYSDKVLASDDGVVKAVGQISINNDNALLAEIDVLLWNFCAGENGAVCTETPNCGQCPIQQYCSYKRIG